jgi:6,7-dimethyl-8-ribityllumazine synthase/transcription antitermination factor NusB
LSTITGQVWKTRLPEPEAGHAFTFWAWVDPLKGKPVAVEGDLSAAGMRFAIVVARWNAVITDRLLEGALDAMLRRGAKRDDIEVVRVPGAWEIPAAARTLAESANQNRAQSGRQLDAIITLGCLLRGETAHYEAIYTEVARGIGQSQQETGIPHSFGVLTCETLEQALNRAGIKAGKHLKPPPPPSGWSLRRKLEGGTLCRDARKSRELAVQMPFKRISQADAGQVAPILTEDVGRCADLPRIFRVANAHLEKIDELIVQNSKHWRIERMPAVDRNLLRVAIGEMLGFKSTPFPIVINEALEIARRYSAPESINFLNGMLDSIARSLLPK